MYNSKGRFTAKYPFFVMILILIKQNILSLLGIRKINLVWFYDLSNLILSKIVKKKLLNNTEHNFKNLVLKGPFKGLEIDTQSYTPSQILGMYEHEIHILLESKILKKKYESLINLGVANGYYFLGFLKYGNFSKGAAVDIDTIHFETIKKLIKKNNINCHISFFDHLNKFDSSNIDLKKNNLVFCDIEGEEVNFLDSLKRPWLLHSDIIVETHNEKILLKIEKDFQKSHKLTRIINSVTINFDLPKSVIYQEKFLSIDKLVLSNSLKKDKAPWLFLEKK